MGRFGTFVRSVNRRNISAFFSRVRSKGLRRAIGDVKEYEDHCAKIEDNSELPMLMELVEPTEDLTIPLTDDPKVSIVIPVYNHYKETYNCIKSVIENTSGIDYEIIIGDDCSTDETLEIKNQIHNVIVNRNQTNTGFTLNCNNASELARGDYILFLNNDTLVEEDWLSPLVSLIESDDTIGMVGSKLVYPTGRLQEAGGILWSDGSAWNYGNCQDPNLAQFNYVKETDYISGAAIMIRRTLFEEIGRFDARYAPAYCEDSDLAFEVRKHGYKVVYQPKSVVYHFEGVSNGKILTAGLKAYQVVNQSKFMEKWRDVLEREHKPNAVDVFHARDRTIGKETVVIIGNPVSDPAGCARNAFLHAILFKELGLVVKVLSPESDWISEYIDRLQQNGVETVAGSLSKASWDSWIRENAEYLDYVFIDGPDGAAEFLDAVKAGTSAKVIYSSDQKNGKATKAEKKVIRSADYVVAPEVDSDIENWMREAKPVYSAIIGKE